MNMICFTTGEWISIAAIIIPLLLGLIVLALRGEILSKVNKKLEPIQIKVNELEIDMNVMTATLKGIAESIKENHSELKKIIKENDKSTKELIREKETDSNKQFENVWKAVTSKADKA